MTTGVVVRIVHSIVVVERDQTDRPVVDALLDAGIPRANIILAYLGEPVPQSA